MMQYCQLVSKIKTQIVPIINKRQQLICIFVTDFELRTIRTNSEWLLTYGVRIPKIE